MSIPTLYTSHKMGFLSHPILSPLNFIVVLAFLSSWGSFTSTEAYDPLDPTGNITIKWDVLSWTPDGYIAVATISNYQLYRHIESPGWSLGWTWAGREVIWSMAGAQTTEQGDCSRFKGNIPHSCKKKPTVVDLMPGVPYNQQIANCCRDGVLSAWLQDPSHSASSFQIAVGAAGTTNRTVRLPRNFTLRTPGAVYVCSPTKVVKPTIFISPDGRRFTQAMMTWSSTCVYSRFLTSRTPSCCVSLSSFKSNKTIPCPTCSCACHNNHTRCINPNPVNPSSVASGKSLYSPVLQCTSHMCPIGVHWHVKRDYKNYWSVKITVTNFNYNSNYSDWNLVAQNPNFDNLSRVSGFRYKSPPHSATNDTAMLWGVSYDDSIKKAGPDGYVQGELLFRKDKGIKKEWLFPKRVYFNGDFCIMPASSATMT